MTFLGCYILVLTILEVKAQDEKADSTPSLGLVIGIIVGVLFLIAAIIVLGSLIWYKMQKKMLKNVLEDAE